MNDIADIQRDSACEGQDSDANRRRRLNKLRDQGLQEMFFALNNNVHSKECKDLLCELDFHKLPYTVVEVEGVAFVLMTDEVVKATGVRARRVCVKTALNTESEA